MLKKIIAGVVLAIVIFLIVGYMIVDEPLPEGKKSPAAEMLADNMMLAINHEAWLKTGAVSWTFRGIHDFVWDRERHYTRVTWEENQVWLDINNKSGKVLVNGAEVDQEKTFELLNTAWEFWANDSFWLNPISKIKDPGTERSLVKTEDGKNALLVSYSSGGVTPGDSYLWIVDDYNMVTACKMWVSIIPIGGVEFSWLNWQVQATGFTTALDHIGPIPILLTNVEAASSLVDLAGEDIFEEM